MIGHIPDTKVSSGFSIVHQLQSSGRNFHNLSCCNFPCWTQKHINLWHWHSWDEGCFQIWKGEDLVTDVRIWIFSDLFVSCSFLDNARAIWRFASLSQRKNMNSVKPRIFFGEFCHEAIVRYCNLKYGDVKILTQKRFFSLKVEN